MLKITCPHCGNRGRAGQNSTAFVIVGRYAGKLARRCSACGKGLLVLFPHRVKRISDEIWESMLRHWDEQRLLESAQRAAGYY